MRILGIETSADDTGVALIDAEGDAQSFRCNVLANEQHSQTEHRDYGGIYPNLAKNEHIKNLPRLLESVLKDSVRIDAIAVTVGPGLEPCLWTGINAAQALSKERDIPVVPVNHMEGHILISMTDVPHSNILQNVRMSEFKFPVIALLISGGHTELILLREWMSYEYIGRTRDDAVGEAFDKVGRLLGLPYPGGPEISRLAEYARSSEMTSHWIHLPRPMMHDKSYDFSFAGLKTAVLRHIETHPLQSLDRERMAREFEDAVTDVLVYKTRRAVEEYGASAVVLGGGVSANKHIRSELNRQLSTVNCQLLVCPPEYSTDNALMIALAGYFHAQKKEFVSAENLEASGRLKLC